MARLTLTLEIPEKNALIALAAKELRDPRYQAVLIIRQELERHGLLLPPEEARQPAVRTSPEVQQA